MDLVEWIKDEVKFAIENKENIPLMPIYDTDDAWSSISCKFDDYTSYQCNRYSALFKDVYKDGTIKYSDVERVKCYNIFNSEIPFINTFINYAVVDKMFPIKMPYYPSLTPYKVYVDEYLFDDKNGDFDTIVVRYLITPDGEHVEVSRYFTMKDSKMIEITEDRFMQLHNKSN